MQLIYYTYMYMHIILSEQYDPRYAIPYMLSYIV